MSPSVNNNFASLTTSTPEIQRSNESTNPANKTAPVDSQIRLILEKKDQTIKELNDHIAVSSQRECTPTNSFTQNLETRLLKMDQVLKIKETKIQQLSAKLQKMGVSI
jgi:hypothetical protein